MKRITTRTNPDETGDLVDPWDQYWAGTISLLELPADMQEKVRAILRGEG